jgi:hypothetical protein
VAAGAAALAIERGVRDMRRAFFMYLAAGLDHCAVVRENSAERAAVLPVGAAGTSCLSP